MIPFADIIQIRSSKDQDKIYSTVYSWWSEQKVPLLFFVTGTEALVKSTLKLAPHIGGADL